MDTKVNILPLISVIIPTYKRPSFLSRAIDSVLGQTYPNTEIIVVDDNDPSSIYREQTEQVMRPYLHLNNILYIKHNKNKNGAAARNTGFTNSHGAYICYLDDDDWYLPNKLSSQLLYLQRHPGFSAVYCGYSRDGVQKRPYKEGDLTFELLSGIDVIYTNTIMMKSESISSCGGWDIRFKRNQEAVFLLRYFSCGGLIGAIPDILVKFDISDASNRSNPFQFEKDFSYFLDIHSVEIERCSQRYPNARQLIYCYRYRGVLLNYIKSGCFKEALSLYCKASHLYHPKFRQICLQYIKRRMLKQPIFKEFERIS